MAQQLLRKSGVASAKTVGFLAREALTVAEMAGSLPKIVKGKTVETVQATGGALRIHTLKRTMKKLKRKQLATFTTAGKTIFALTSKHLKNIKQKSVKDNVMTNVNNLFSESKQCEQKTLEIDRHITNIEKRSTEAVGYHEALLNLDSRMRNVRFAAVRTLEQLGDKNTIPIMLKKLGDPDPRVRRQITESLHRMIDRMAVPV